METMTKEQHVATVPARWRMQYGKGDWLKDFHKQDTQRRLDLVTIPNENKYCEIIGNGSWTSFTCDSCGKEVNKIVFVNSRASEEYGESAFCKKCLEGYLKAINQDGAREPGGKF